MASHPEVARFDWSWVWMQVMTYVKIDARVEARSLEARVPDVVRRRGADAFDRLGIAYDELVSAGGKFTFVFQPLDDVYLGSTEIGNRLGPVGNRAYVMTALLVAVFVLLIACINFMNLATARSVTRSREVGIRKVLGSPRKMLVGQFLAESLVFSALAVPLALLIVIAAMGPFNQLTGKALELHVFRPAWLPAAAVLLPIVVGLVAGSYPGIYLSSFRPVHVLKGSHRAGGGSRRFRHALVVFQFALTIGLLVCTLLVQEQLQFMRETDLGFDRKGIVVLDNENRRLGDQENAFKERLEQHPEIAQASITTSVPPYYGFEDGYNVEGLDNSIGLNSYLVDEDFMATLGIDILQGRGFSREFGSDAESIILNEAAVKAFGLIDPIGRIIEYPGGNARFRVIGVMEDFNFVTLRSPVTPFALFHRASVSYQISDSYVVVRLAGGDLDAAINVLASEWRAVVPGMPFDYFFLDDSFEEQYLNERRLGRMFGVFSFLAICIACLGLLGLAAFAAEQRTKEIGIRKVMGADVTGLVALLTGDFLKMVGIAFVIAAPAAYFAMRTWLEDFVYRIEIGPSLFLLSGGLVLIVALLTVSYQSIRAALANPVKSLRHE
jgi:putative ABC transport system permease protein